MAAASPYSLRSGQHAPWSLAHLYSTPRLGNISKLQMPGLPLARQPLPEPRQPQPSAAPASRRSAPRAPTNLSARYLDGMLLEGPDLAAQLPTLLLHPAAAARHLSCSGLRMVELRYAASSNPTSGQLDRLPRLSDLPCQICAEDHEWPAHRLHLGALMSARPAEGTDLDVTGR